MASGTRWSVRFECALPAALLRLRDQIVERLIEVAQALADLIHPQSPFRTHEQGLEMHFEGWRIGYRVDLQQARIRGRRSQTRLIPRGPIAADPGACDAPAVSFFLGLFLYVAVAGALDRRLPWRPRGPA